MRNPEVFVEMCNFFNIRDDPETGRYDKILDRIIARIPWLLMHRFFLVHRKDGDVHYRLRQEKNIPPLNPLESDIAVRAKKREKEY